MMMIPTPEAMIPTPEALLQRAGRFIDAGQLDSAHLLLDAARAHHGATTALTLLDAQLACRERSPHRAVEMLDRAILRDPAHAGLRKQRSDLRFRLGDHAGAVEDAAEAIGVDPRDAEAKAMLGNALLELGRADQAIACLDDAVASAPTHAGFRQQLSHALARCGHPALALRVLTDGVALGPPHVGLFNAAIRLCLTHDAHAQAQELAEQARRAGVADAETFTAMGRLLLGQGRRADAGIAFQNALKLHPEDRGLRHAVAACGLMDSWDRTPIEFLGRGLAEIDASAATSRAAVVEAIVARHLDAAGETPILDLGCGTGMLGDALATRPHGPLTGIDACAARLAQARAGTRYTELREADIQSYLVSSDGCAWPSIVAATALHHFGDLSGVLRAIRARLDTAGRFIGSIEMMPRGSWQLQRHGRFAHTLDYAYACIGEAGMRVLRRESIAIQAASGNHPPARELLTIGPLRQ